MSEQTDSQAYPQLTKAVVNEILEGQAPYRSEDEKETCKRMVEALSQEEQRIASCTSYAYWFAATYFQEDDKPSKEVGIRMAMREARRHLVGSGDDEELAKERLSECLRFRKEYQLDLLRSCFQILPKGINAVEGTPGEEEVRTRFRAYIEEELKEKQQFFVRGQDLEGRAVAIKMDRQSPETTPEAYTMTQIYIAERVVACTEFLTRGKEEKVVAVMDYQNYSSSNAPPIMTMKDAISLLQANYPERLKTCIITEPAYWMQLIFKVLYPLMSTDTREKVQMAYGEGKNETIRAIISPQQALPFMIPEAKLTTPFDSEKFLKEVPFHCVFDSP